MQLFALNLALDNVERQPPGQSGIVVGEGKHVSIMCCSPCALLALVFNILQFSLESSGRQSCSVETGSVRRMTFAVLDSAERERGERETQESESRE